MIDNEPVNDLEKEIVVRLSKVEAKSEILSKTTIHIKNTVDKTSSEMYELKEMISEYINNQSLINENQEKMSKHITDDIDPVIEKINNSEENISVFKTLINSKAFKTIIGILIIVAAYFIGKY